MDMVYQERKEEKKPTPFEETVTSSCIRVYR